MKLLHRLFRPLWAIALVCLIFSCMQEDPDLQKTLDKEGSELLDSDENARRGSRPIRPSGDQSGATDADAIEAALNDAGSGATVRLGAGTFYVNRPIVSAGFNGTLAGVGKKKTTIKGVGTPDAPFGLTAVNEQPGQPAILRSVLLYLDAPEGYLSVRNLTFTIDEGFQTEPDAFGGTTLTSFLTVQIRTEDVDTSFEELCLIGVVNDPNNPFANFQPTVAMNVWGNGDTFPQVTSGGRHEVRRCLFDKSSIQALVIQSFRNAYIKTTDNTFVNVKQYNTRYLDGGFVYIARNEMENHSFGGIVVTQEFQPVGQNRTRVVITNNRIKTNGYMSIEIGTAPNFSLYIARNHIETGPDPFSVFPNQAGIGLFPGQDKAKVFANTIKGTPENGIHLIETTNSGVFFNNLKGATPGRAHITLEPGSDNNRIVRNLGATVIDDLGSGNVIR